MKLSYEDVRKRLSHSIAKEIEGVCEGGLTRLHFPVNLDGSVSVSALTEAEADDRADPIDILPEGDPHGS